MLRYSCNDKETGFMYQETFIFLWTFPSPVEFYWSSINHWPVTTCASFWTAKQCIHKREELIFEKKYWVLFNLSHPNQNQFFIYPLLLSIKFVNISQVSFHSLTLWMHGFLHFENYWTHTFFSFKERGMESNENN